MMGLSSLLTHPDIMHWHEDIADLFDCSTDESLPSRLSGVFNKFMRHDAFILKLYKAGSDLPIIISHDIPPHQHDLYFDRYLSSAYLEDPLLARLQSDDSPQIVQINHHTCQLRGSTYYRSYYKDLNLQDEIDVLLPMPNGDSLVMSIDRRNAVTSKEEIAILENTYTLVKRILIRYYAAQLGDANVAEEPSDGAPDNIEQLLTTREREVVQLMVSGKGTKDLARHLGISFQTVKVHRRNIYSKLGISSELQLCSLFLGVPKRPALANRGLY
ncbi:response regulator transcription factor [Affinibrenneria salicis]|uniref:Response regulator transcription factor n=1 Tax=Affinibrenneria salicis TaxID=2590031 RepID=A0A5J5FWR6_9GAMM|nr:LuxR C-terminal-related transcriptional regulator [Affinibrenneria salicis]KAA8998430.1 response regulator transcription factor [Affinibrenneria salicis]